MRRLEKPISELYLQEGVVCMWKISWYADDCSDLWAFLEKADHIGGGTIGGYVWGWEGGGDAVYGHIRGDRVLGV